MTRPDAVALRLWSRQAWAVARLELTKLVRGRRLVALALLNLAPVILLALTHLIPEGRIDGKLASHMTPADLSRAYAGLYAVWVMKIAVFFTAAHLAVALVRNEVLEKTLHYYFLAPVRRQVVVTGKFLAATIASSALCGAGAAGSFLVLFAWLGDGFGRFVLGGAGLGHLAAYLGITVLGCLGYGAVFALFGLLWRNPMIPVLLLFGWESMLFLLPPFLKLASVQFYLASLLPLRPGSGPFAFLAEPPPPLASIAGMVVFAAVVLALAGWRASRMELSYSTD